jgi:hypothetical protein
VGLVLSGMTAQPVQTQLDLAASVVGDRVEWLSRVRADVTRINAESPYIFYGYDWLAFGHYAIAIVFVWAYREPKRHAFLFDYGLILCGLVVVFALTVAPFRGVPFWWRLLDCSFGVVGAIPLWLARTWTKRLINEAPANSV